MVTLNFDIFKCYAKKQQIKVQLREAEKKVLLLIAGQLRPNPPPPLELYGRCNFGTLKKR